jgi:hypothetical protein
VKKVFVQSSLFISLKGKVTASTELGKMLEESVANFKIQFQHLFVQSDVKAINLKSHFQL